MRCKKYTKEIGVTAACSMRLSEIIHDMCHEETQTTSRENTQITTYTNNDNTTTKKYCFWVMHGLRVWFSQKTMAKQGNQFIGVVKSNHRNFPKEWVLTTMKGLRAGSQVVLRSVVGGVTLFAIGWNYKKKKTV